MRLSSWSPIWAALVAAVSADTVFASVYDDASKLYSGPLRNLRPDPNPPKSEGQGASNPTNTNDCIAQVGPLASAFATPFTSDEDVENICVTVGTNLVEAYSMGCFCNPTMGVLVGEVIVKRMLLALPACRGTISVEDVNCKKLENHDYGCKVENMALDAARLTSVQRFGAAFDGAGPDQCFDFEAVKYELRQVFVENPTLFVPYGAGLYEGLEKSMEYYGIYFSAFNRNFWTPGPSIPYGGQFASEGTTFTTISGGTGAFALGKILFGNGAEGQLPPYITFNKMAFEKCSDKISSVEILPTEGMAWLISNFQYFAQNYDMWGLDSICEVDDQICRPDGHSAYADKNECLEVIGSLPMYSEKCGPNRPFYGNSLSCKWKHHFMAALVPETHCKHLGPEGTADPEGALKCFDEIECAESPEAYKAILDATAQALGLQVGSNYVTNFEEETLPDEYEEAQIYTDELYDLNGWQPPVLTCPKIDGIWRGFAPEFFPGTNPPFPNQFSTPNGDDDEDGKGDSLPITLEEAEAEGWVEDGEISGLWVNSDSTFGLYFESEGELSGFRVTGPAVIVPFPVPSPIPIPIPIPGTIDNDDGTISYDFHFGEDSWTLGDEIDIPLRAEAAEEDGWLQGSCLEAMGGTHYFKQELSLPGITLLYNKYGDGKLTAVIPIFGLAYDPQTPPSPLPFANEFDLSGSLTPFSRACDSTYCGDPICRQTYCSGDGVDGCSETDIFPFVTNVHVYFKDPAFVQTASYAGFPIAKCSSVTSPCWLRQTAFDLGEDFLVSGFSCDCSVDGTTSGY